MEDLLREISFNAGRQNLWDSFNHDGFTGYPFDGELGDKVHFSGVFCHNKDREEDSYAKINLHCQDNYWLGLKWNTALLLYRQYTF